MAYEIYSNTVQILPGNGYVAGDSIENPFYITNTDGQLAPFFLGNIDLVHMKSVTSAGSVDSGGDGRNMILVRIETKEADFQPNPRTGNPTAIAESEVIAVSVVTEKTWNSMSLEEQKTWLILAYATDENVKTIKGLYEPPCDINASVIHGNWSPALVKVEDARKMIPHVQALKYSENDEIPVRPVSPEFNPNLAIEQPVANQLIAPMFDNDPLLGPVNIFKTNSGGNTELSAFDSSMGIMFTTAHMGSIFIILTIMGSLRRKI
jgi:hypothetical protein